MQAPIIVTGGSSGIGLETAVHLAKCGLPVIATMRNPSRATRLQEEAARRNTHVETLALDVTSEESIQSAVASVIGRYGGIAGLVHNAGIQIRGYFEDLTPEDIDRVFQTNLFGVMALTRAVLPHMRRAGSGRIVLVSSVGGMLGSPALSAYSASKFALEGFGECLALEVAPLGIRVSLIEPGIVNTEMWGKNRGIAQKSQDPAGPYFAWFNESERMADTVVKSSATTPADVARAVHRALAERHPRLRYLVGRKAGMVLTARRLLPGEIFAKLYSRLVTPRSKIQ